jgi:hypothetical protein
MGDEDDQPWQPVKHRNRRGKQLNFDIATANRSNTALLDNITTYFFTNFPDSFGAKEMFNAFQYYGDINEVVIPAKRDKGGGRFGFARFNRVVDAHHSELELDTII